MQVKAALAVRNGHIVRRRTSAAALFVQLATAQPAAVTIHKNGGKPASARSILAVMALGAKAGDEVVLTADGDGAEESLDALETYLSTDQ